jgi:hypothetical protein
MIVSSVLISHYHTIYGLTACSIHGVDPSVHWEQQSIDTVSTGTSGVDPFVYWDNTFHGCRNPLSSEYATKT